MKVFSGLSFVLLSCISSTVADYTVKVAVSVTTPKWDGWGTSLAWWANVFGDRTDLADLFFTNSSSVSIEGGPANLPALGLNIARYNIGGTSTNTINTPDDGKQHGIKTSPRMPAFRAIESFWLDWFNTDPTSPSWNWKADPKQRAMLVAASKRGANILEAFSNSPPWWMTYNHAVSGSDKKNQDNLQDWNHDKFAHYLATVVHQADTEWGVKFQYVEPFNEPSADWWTYPGTQEGCHFSWEAQKDIIKRLRFELDTFAMQSVGIAASDENTVDQTLKTLLSMNKERPVIDVIAKVNTHGYEGLEAYRGPTRGPLKAFASKLKKKLWDSEYGEKDASGLTMAESIALDINELGVSAFVYWQVLDSGGWGLIQSNPGDNWMGGPNPKYYVMAQYSRHIRPGCSILGSDDVKTVVAYDLTRKVLVIVTVNVDAAPQSIKFDLSDYLNAKVGVYAKSWVTETSQAGMKYTEVKDAVIKGKIVTARLAPQSVRTIEIPFEPTNPRGKVKAFP